MQTLTQIIEEGIGIERHGVDVLVTPECASRALAYNFKNRLVRQRWVAELIKRIKDGRFVDSHPHGIIFSDSRLIDGQHRLMAIVQAKQNVVMRVDTGRLDGVREFINDGPARQVYDRISLVDNETLNKRLIELLSAWSRIHLSVRGGGIPTAIVKQAWDHIGPHALQVVQFTYPISSHRDTRGLMRSAVCAAVCSAMLHDAEFGMQFLKSYMLPDGELQPARVLREWLIRTSGPSSGRHMAQRVDYSYSMMAIRAAFVGRTIKIVKQTSELGVEDLVDERKKMLLKN